MSESKQKLSRRDFLKLTFSLPLLPLEKNLRPLGKLLQPLSEAPGDFASKEPEKSSKAPENFSLPEKEVTDRVWERIVSMEVPPAGYRQAAVWHPGRESFIVHGGWGSEGNTDQTWELKNGQWQLLEQGSTPKLSGHKTVYTPRGVFMYGGVEVLQNGQNAVKNKGYLFNETTFEWEEVVFDQILGEVSEVRQGMGMTYDSVNKVIWIIAGADVGGISSNIAWIIPPETEQDEWQFRRLRQSYEYELFPRLFEPLTFMVDNSGYIYVYGGLKDSGSTRVDSRDIYKISHHINIYGEIIAEVYKADWQLVDYAGPVRGGFDSNRNQLILNGGSTPNLLGQIHWQESVLYYSEGNEWGTLKADSPQYVEKAAASIDERGNVYRFGGVYYQNGYPVFTNETWVLRPIEKVHLPLIYR